MTWIRSNWLVDEATTAILQTLSEAGYGCQSSPVMIDAARHDQKIKVVKGKGILRLLVSFFHGKVRVSFRPILSQQDLFLSCGRSKIRFDNLAECVTLVVKENI